MFYEFWTTSPYFNGVLSSVSDFRHGASVEAVDIEYFRNSTFDNLFSVGLLANDIRVTLESLTLWDPDVMPIVLLPASYVEAHPEVLQLDQYRVHVVFIPEGMMLSGIRDLVAQATKDCESWRETEIRGFGADSGAMRVPRHLVPMIRPFLTHLPTPPFLTWKASDWDKRYACMHGLPPISQLRPCNGRHYLYPSDADKLSAVLKPIMSLIQEATAPASLDERSSFTMGDPR